METSLGWDETVRADDEVHLLATITQAISEAIDLQTAYGVALRSGCEAMGWAVGQVWTVCTDETALECSPVWHSTVDGWAEFRNASERCAVGPGVGCVGQAWVSKQPVWACDAAAESHRRKARLASEAGFGTALAVPVLLKGEVVAVLEFLALEPRGKDERIVGLAALVAAQLGLAIQRRRTEEALRESEELFRSLSACSPIGILLTDTAGNCIYANPRCRAIFGFSLMGTLGAGWLQAVHPQERETVAGHWYACTRNGQDFAREFRLQLAQGAIRWVQMRAATMFSDAGHVTGYVAAVEDITEPKRAERKREELLAAEQAARAEAETARDQLRRLSRRLVDAQELERRRVAGELHDEVGQRLTMLKLTLDTCARSSPDALGAKLTGAQTAVEQLLALVRNLSLELRPSMLDDLGLLPALLWHFDRYSAQSQVHVDFKHRGLQGRRFAPDVETAAYRIVQEALTNVARHADANEARVQVLAGADVLEVQIEDSGRGFDPAAALAAGSSGGLYGMRERAVLLGGQLTIDSTAGAGTCVRARLPLGKANEKPGKPA